MLGLGGRTRGVAIGIVLFGLPASPAKAQASGSASPVRVRDGFTAAAVRRALSTVRRRLADTECSRIFADFSDARGTPLRSILEERGQTPEAHLDTLLFYDGSSSPACIRSVLAITTPGSRVVFVCGPRLAKVRNRKVIEALIIHEMLHTLGLGEDPPPSAAITARVVSRCGL